MTWIHNDKNSSMIMKSSIPQGLIAVCMLATLAQPLSATPAAVAGVDRVVMLAGKTYLSGRANGPQGNSTTFAWSKASGPGEVAFDNPAASLIPTLTGCRDASK